MAAPPPGTILPSTTTIDSIFTTLFGTRSTHTSSTPVYKWSDQKGRIIGIWPDGTMCIAHFEARPFYPAVLRL